MTLIPDELADRAARFPDRVAVTVDGHGSMTFAEWHRRSNALARALRSFGVRTGARVVLLLENSDALVFQVGYPAAHKAGCVAVPVNPRYAPREIEHILGNCEAEVVVTAGPQLDRVRELRDRFPSVRLVVAPGASGEGEADFDELVSGDATDLPSSVTEDDLADILYTSGTTGLPKGVASTHANATAFPVDPVEDGGVFLHSIPLPTFFGTHGTQLLAMRLAMTNLVLPSFDVARFAELVAERRPAWILMVPAHILLLKESGVLDGVDTSSVKMVLFGSAPTPAHAIEWLGRQFPSAVMMNGYGLTEAGGSVCMCVLLPGDAEKRAGSVGRPLPGAEVRVVGDDASDCPPDEIGEVLLRVKSGRRYYYGDPELTARTWEDDGWVHTGDLGYLDADGYLYVVDRKKDMIVRGGYNVYSIEVETALTEHPAVAEAAVVGIPHDILGQDIAAVVRIVDGQPEPSLDDLRAFMADRLADYKLPRRLEVRHDPLPRSGMGKVDKKRLLADLTGDEPAPAGA